MPGYYYQVVVRHPGLGKQRVIRGADRNLVESAGLMQQRVWNEQYAKKLEVAERHRERESRRRELEDSLREADERTREAQQSLDELHGLLAATLSVDDRIDWNRLKQHQAFLQPPPKQRAYLPFSPEPQAGENRYRPQLGLIDKFLPSAAAKKQQAAQALFEADHAKWKQHIASIKVANQQVYEANCSDLQDWQQRAKAFEDARAKHNEAVERRRTDYQALVPEAILDYCDMVLSQSKYPDCFPQNFDVDYRANTKTVIVEYQLPAPEDLPRLTAVKFVRSRNEFVESELTKRQFEELYEEVACQVALRILHELFEADVVRALDSVVFNGTVRAVNPATGTVETRCIMSVHARGSDFVAINLRQIECRACFDSLGGVAANKLVDLRPVTRLAVIDQADDRFSRAEDVSGAGAAGLDEWQVLTSTISDPEHIRFISLGTLATLLGFPASEKYSAAISKALANAVAARGFALEPDVRYGWPSYRAADEVALFRPLESKVTDAYSGAAALLHLCVMIAAADNQPTEEELKVARDFIQRNVPLTSQEEQRLLMLEHLLCRNPESTKRSLTRLAQRLPTEQRQMIGEVLVCVAGADGKISSSEWAALDRACKALELPAAGLEDILRRLGASFEEPVVQEAVSGEPGEPIAAGAATAAVVATPAFRLDMARIAAISKETAQVVTLLAAVMSEDVSASPMKAVTTPPSQLVPALALAPVPPSSPAPEIPEWLRSLDAKFQPIAARVVAKPSWTRADFQRLAAEFKLMPLGAFDALNEWADEHLGDFLLEGEDPVNVNTKIIPK